MYALNRQRAMTASPVWKGLTYQEHGLLSHIALREFVKPILGAMMDWMHNWFVNGVANLEFHLYLQRARDEMGVKCADLHRVTTASWAWPKWQETHKASRAHSGAV